MRKPKALTGEQRFLFPLPEKTEVQPENNWAKKDPLAEILRRLYRQWINDPITDKKMIAGAHEQIAEWGSEMPWWARTGVDDADDEDDAV
jgi:hypothetical protein